MKKVLVSMFLFVFCLCLLGCENIGNNKLLRNQAGYAWLDDINIENIEKVQIEFGDGMTYIGNTQSIYSSIEVEVIKDVFDYWYNCKVEQYSQENEGVMDAGTEHTKFYLNTGEVKEIAIIGIYLKDSNGMDFKVKSPYRMDESKFLRTYKFVTDEEYGKLYEYTPIMEYAYIGDVPMKEIEFMEMMDEIYLEGVVSQYFIETNFGKIHFLLDVYFWVERTNVSSENEIPIYYQLYNTSIYDLAEKYMNLNNEETYKLTIQNQTAYELIGIKNEYKADEEVEVKMIYEDCVCTFAFLDGELLGELNGSDSIKFNMPAKDSVLTINYSGKFITVIHPEFIYHFLTGFDSVILSDGKGSASVNKAYSDFSSQTFFEEFSLIEVTVIKDNDDFQMTGVDYHITFNNSFDDFVSLKFYNINDLDNDKVTNVYYGRLKCFSNPSVNYQFTINKDIFYEIIDYFFNDTELASLFYSLQESFDNGFLTNEDLQQIANLNNNGPFNPVEIDQNIAILIMKDFCEMHNTEYEENGGSVRCFGEYNGYYAVMVDGCGIEYTTAIDSEVVDGITFIYGSSQHILLWKYHQ